MTGAVYRGVVRHRRVRGAAPTDFTHPLSLIYAELDDLPRLLGGRLVRRTPGLVRIRPRDLHGRAHDLGGLQAALRRTVARRTGRPAPGGRIGVLTHPRIAGLCFNPVSFYYLFDEAGELDTVVAEVTSTPWRERHAYVLRAELPGHDDQPGQDGEAHTTGGGGLAGEHAKAIRVSPFQPLAQRYRWTVSPPGEHLTARIINRATADGAVDLTATLDLQREPLTPKALRELLRHHPAGTLRVLGLIYGHAVALKLRGAPVHRSARLTGQGGT